MENLLEILLDNIPCSIWLRDIDGKFIFVNKYYSDTLNLSKEEVIGKTLEDIYPDELAFEYKSNYEEVIKEDKPKLFSGYLEDVFLECYIKPIKKDGKIALFLGILQDQTKRKHYEEQIISQKDLLQTIIDTVPDCIVHKDKNGKYLDCNSAFAKVYYKKNKEEILGKTDKELAKLLSQDDH